MNRFMPWMTMGIIVAVMILLRGPEADLRAKSRAAQRKEEPCAKAEYHQFDFWIGDWDAFDADNLNLAVARTRVDRILDGCVLREDYQDIGGLKGQSFSLYDMSRGVWHQSWVTNRGRLLVIEGKLENGEMILSGEDRTADGKARRVRGVWKSTHDSVRETAVTSIDGGKAWQPWFAIVFRPHRQ